jgi:DNA-binding CsgD family transcriptional regulator
MRVAIIGAGVAGLTTAKVLSQAGHDVLVHDRAPDVGGVWSAGRRYPGLTTQSPKAQYSLSDFPMPKDFPQWPTGAQVQAYLAAYAGRFGLEPSLRLDTEVTAVAPDPAGGWAVETRDAAGTASTDRVDRVVVANGVFCEPAMPEWPGREEFAAAGGEVIAGTELHDAERARGRHVLVVGYGKSACDVTVPISQVAASTDVIARHLLWKVPRKIGGFLNFKLLLLTRMGEALFRYLRPRGFERFLHGPAKGVRRNMSNSIGSVSVRQFGLAKLGLVPPGQMEDIVRGAIGLAPEGFFEGVAAGAITVHADRVVTRLHADGGLDLSRRLGLGLSEVWSIAALGELELSLGHPEPALACFEEQQAVLTAHGIRDVDLSPAPELVQLYLRLGRTHEAADAADEYSHAAAAKGQPWALARAARCRALVAPADAPDGDFETALALHEKTPDVFETARTQLAYGSYLRRARKRVQAREQLRAAIGIFDTLGAGPWSEMARHELAATGETARRRNPATIDELTPQELQIALRVAEGRTTRETAAALFLSPKTIEHHLHNVYRKLAISSRRELVEAMTRHPQSTAPSPAAKRSTPRPEQDNMYTQRPRR